MALDTENAAAIGALVAAPLVGPQVETAQPVGDRWVVMMRWLDGPRQLAH